MCKMSLEEFSFVSQPRRDLKAPNVNSSKWSGPGFEASPIGKAPSKINVKTAFAHLLEHHQLRRGAAWHSKEPKMGNRIQKHPSMANHIIRPMKRLHTPYCKDTKDPSPHHHSILASSLGRLARSVRIWVI